MNKLKKIVSIIIIMIITVMCCSNISYVYATGKGGGSVTDKHDINYPIIDPNDYKPTDTTGGNTEFINMGNILIGTMRVVGTVIAVVALMVIGLRYMFGSTQEKASYKETMIPYLIGAIMLFTIPNVLGIIYDLVKGINF